MVLTHPSITDGWFREISAQWPGQAMSLKVRKILHVERSKFQDVLVFESETYGNVLVLDGVIQCTERDEFSYQEMIAHIPLASHPNPNKVLVIGGGDGGVVREVLKHSTVQHVVLCDIDEAVIRVSKQYLPHMSSLLEDKRVTVHVESYDVIITDSSDPVGPAQALFEKPYFQLLHDALRDGGSISTQGECQWLHLPFIKEINVSTKTIFPVTEYAFTTIPTYPSGQIGFVVATKDNARDLKVPIRDVPNCRYWTQEVHKSAFILPNSLGTIPKKILLLGSGFVAKPAAEYIVRGPINQLTIACRTLASAESLAADLPRTTAISLDVNNTSALEAEVAKYDVVISLIPYMYHAAVIKAAIKGRTHVVTTSYVSPAMRELDEEAKKAGVVVMNEIGLDPGIDHLYAVKTIDEVHEKGGKVVEFLSFCGGLPSAPASHNPLGYKFSWSSRGVLLALLNNASFYQDGQVTRIPGSELMKHAKPYYISPAYAFTVIRGTLRYQGFPEFVATLVKLGWLDDKAKGWLKDGISFMEATQLASGARASDESALVEHIRQIVGFPSEAEASRIISGLRWIGLLSRTEKVIPKGSPVNLLDTLCGRLEGLMKFKPGETDLVMLQHKFVVEWKSGKKAFASHLRTETITSTLEEYGSPLIGGDSAMSRLVGVPCGIAVQAILDGSINTPGILVPYTKEICHPLRLKLEEEGITMIECVL
ncbi:saccharopine dehydrogenase [Cantharellus anzutake]|uniref:saccharopine dehydrogenase n=1 Tax=Cantharellus anzutake TaxID=1750568 RepID=UPI0019072631|nr:saccharopine dehydrogenase [Cantharellus anzutake]KAF8324714.1 saccharopine dehydrogenase [Cantharellus anzutake]